MYENKICKKIFHEEQAFRALKFRIKVHTEEENNKKQKKIR